jgi:hypothetical protein
MRSRDKVAIGWLDPGVVDGAFMLAVCNLYANHPKVTSLIRIVARGLLSRGRNQMVAGFLAGDCDWLLILDSDMRFKEGRELADFDALCSSVHDAERPVVAGLYFGAWPGEFYPQAIPLIFACQTGTNSRFVPLTNYPDNAVFPIDSAGTGCLMVHRSVFERIRDNSPLPQHQGGEWCWFQDMPINGDWFSEDHWFCARVRDLGIPIHANTAVVLEHHKSFWLSDKQYVKPEVTQREMPELLERPDRREPLPDLRPGSEHGPATERDDGSGRDVGDDVGEAAAARA